VKLPLSLLLPVALGACAPIQAPNPIDESNHGANALFDVSGAFWSAPFPSDHRVREASRRVDLSGFPNPDGAPLVAGAVAMLDDQVQGFARTGAVFLPFDRAIDPTYLPTLEGSLDPAADVFLMDVDDESPDVGRRYPIHVVTRDVDHALEPAHAIVALPLPGVPLPERRRYAVVVRRTVMDVDGALLSTSRAVDAIVRGDAPFGWRSDVADQYLGAVDVLRDQGVDMDAVAGLTVFTTGGPTRDWPEIVAAARAAGGMSLASNITRTQVWPDFCVYETQVAVPFYQQGAPPFATEGGGLGWDGAALTPNADTPKAIGRLVLTVPRVATADDKRPTVVFVRTGAGGDRPLVDRSVHAVAGVDVPGEGLAALFARRGWAAAQLDGPLGGPLRNPGGADEASLLLNLDNPLALRDTLRQSALELALLPDFLKSFALPTYAPWDCPGIPESGGHSIRFDTDHLALFAHGTGATFAPLAAAVEPRYRALLLSGAGSSWIERVVFGTQPVAWATTVADMLAQPVEAIDEHSPALTLLQWSQEAADPALVGRSLLADADPDDARHVLMFQGLVDHDTPAPAANALSLALGLDLAGDALDLTLAPEQPSLSSLLSWVGGEVRPLPTGLNLLVDTRKVTAVVVQHAADGVEDGHQVVFQADTPRRQIACFLDGLATDAPLVAGPGAEADPCPDPPQAPAGG
jgi:hypothetical protein